MKTAPLIAAALLTALTATADKTTRRGLTPRPPHPPVEAVADTLRGPRCDSVALAGYDKPLRATHETLFATNRLTHAITALGLRLLYTDMAGRTLHERTATVRVLIGPGETRMVKLRSWDTNRSFYYHGGPVPRTTGVTPYDVKASVEFIVTDKPEL